NLEDLDVIAGLAEDVGLDGEEIKAVISEGRYIGALHSQRAQGKGLGIYGIPTFVVEGKLFWGKDVIDDVRDEVARVKQERIEKEKQES
ncbi:MAG: DsbA family protein, partial [Nitrospinae bacterium]|nr:DsbA family protein [Nitrospinota bacterium]